MSIGVADAAGVETIVDWAAAEGWNPGLSDAVAFRAAETNAAARGLAERHGMAPVFETARMYAGDAPSEPVERIFGVTTFELG